MSILFVVAAVVSAGVALGGIVWSSALRRRSRAASAGNPHEVEADAIPSSEPFRNARVADDATEGCGDAERVTGLSLSGVGNQVRCEGWRPALPGLLTAGGMLAMLVCGALALLTSLPSKLLGIAALVVALYIAATELRSFLRSLQG
jgi:hypothetical protein